MRRLVLFFGILLALYLGVVVYCNRALLFSRFDESYWKDKYEQSQWKLPLSPRTIGDDGLYLYEGYRLIRGGDPTSSNAEMPPLGKYLIGASIFVFGNGYIYGFITTFSLIVGTFILTRLLIKQTVPALIVALLLATDPLVTNQFALTMMDSLQASLLILFLVVLFHVTASKQKHSVLLATFSGIILGLFSETKLPVLTPFIGLIGIYYLWAKTRSLQLLGAFISGGIIGYVTPYIVFFVQGHTLLDWLKIQKWIVTFYRHSNLTPTWGSVVTTLLFGSYQNIFSRLWERANEWSPAWAVLFFSSFGALGLSIRRKSLSAQWIVMFILIFITLGLYAVLPFWTRYLVTVLPLLYVTSGLVLSRLPKNLLLLISGTVLIVNVASSVPILFSSPQATANQVIYAIEHQQFTDLYEDTTASFRRSTNRDAFRRFGLITFAAGEIEHINILPTGPKLTGHASPQYLNVQITYYTRRLGSFTQKSSIPFVREDGRWRIPWQWSLLISGLTESGRLETNVIEARRGTLLASDKKPLAEDVPGHLVWVTPQRIDKTQEESLLTLLETVFDGKQPKVALHQRIVGNSLADQAIPLGVIPHPKTDPNVIALASFSGVTLTHAFTRLTYPNHVVDIGETANTAYSECCTVLYSTTNYDGVTGVEKAKNALLKGVHGGTLTLTNSEGKILQTLIEKTKRDGQNVEP